MGIPFGALLWLISDEIALPALRMRRPPTQVPVRKQATALASYLAYGFTADAIRQALMRLMNMRRYAGTRWARKWSSRLARQTRRFARPSDGLRQRTARYGKRLVAAAKRPAKAWSITD
jgi:hypothetical protein